MTPNPGPCPVASVARFQAAAWLDERERWAAERRRIENSRYWVGPDGRRWRWSNSLFQAALRPLALGLRMTGHYQQWRRNALEPELVELELRFAQLPLAFDGYRILHISDPHLDILPELAPITRDMLEGCRVDLLAVTGDVLGVHHAPVTAAARLLAVALESVNVRDKRLAILGNHDPSEMVAALEGIGFRVLTNEFLYLERGGESVAVIGLDDVHCFYTPAADTALIGGDGAFRIALVHSPEMADHAAEAGIALYLCGHTHGGQICLPGGRPLLTSLRSCRYAASGLWRRGPTRGYTSRGLGSSWPPLRRNCPSEITVITLRRRGADVSRVTS